MKKFARITFILLSAIALTFTTACKPDDDTPGGQNGETPQQTTVVKKIKNVYYSYSYQQYNGGTYNSDKYLAQKWNWNNATGLLESIEEYEENTIDFMLNFTYNHQNHIERIDCFKYNIFITYSYDQTNMLNKMELIYKDYETNEEVLVAECIFTYDTENKIKLLSATIFEDDILKSTSKYLNPFSIMFPEQISESILRFEDNLSKNRNGKETIYFTIQLTWQADNISQIFGSGMGESFTATLQYDNKSSFIYGFILGQYANATLVKNNPTMVAVTYDGRPETAMIKYEYTAMGYPTVLTGYDADYPEEQSSLYFEYL